MFCPVNHRIGWDIVLTGKCAEFIVLPDFFIAPGSQPSTNLSSCDLKFPLLEGMRCIGPWTYPHFCVRPG
eukprot:scaffold321929_cov44-Tisochrysis_lutea.AAC.1